jgi:hypothetical protein
VNCSSNLRTLLYIRTYARVLFFPSLGFFLSFFFFGLLLSRSQFLSQSCVSSSSPLSFTLFLSLSPRRDKDGRGFNSEREIEKRESERGRREEGESTVRAQRERAVPLSLPPSLSPTLSSLRTYKLASSLASSLPATLSVSLRFECSERECCVSIETESLLVFWR